VSQLRINVKLAWESVKSNKLRAILTLSIIAFGIMALIGILTAIEGLKSSITDNFQTLGANTFTIRQAGGGPRRRGRQADLQQEPIRYLQALQFKDRYRVPATVSISTLASFNATVQHGSVKTNPNVRVMGTDESYTAISKLELGRGRYFSASEAESGSNVAVIGADVAAKLFGKKNPINGYILVGSSRYEVIGALALKGSSMGNNVDNTVTIPLVNAINRFTGSDKSVAISVAVNDIRQLDMAADEATALMRNIRRLPHTRETDFDVRTSTATANNVIDQLSMITLAATFIGLITLFGAGIGLMNIMLVLVTERTREIGVSKALGATKANIRMQFLTEAVLICQMGGVLGIVLGIAIGNLVATLFSSGFIVPWGWVIGGLTFCFVVGILAGIYPAIKASNLDPIDALRYE
jgi:putative ABC transport system permease protein